MSGSNVHEAPVFAIGMPRSGTSILFEALCSHPDLAWLSQYVNVAPRFGPVSVLARLADRHPALRRRASRWDREFSALDRIRIGPSEAYGLWRRCCGEVFLHSYLLDVRPNPEESECVSGAFAGVKRWQRKPRFAAKLTGPGRIGYLSEIFPDARFVHVIRDGRAVSHSLMHVGFWRDTFRMNEIAWQGGLDDGAVDEWKRTGGGSLGLAAIQWAAVVRTTRREADAEVPGRYLEVRYEEFTARPAQVLAEVFDFCGLPVPPRDLESLPIRPIRPASDRWRRELGAAELTTISALVGDLLVELGYEAG